MIKFRALCICGTHLTSAWRLSHLRFGICLELGWLMDFRTVVRRVMGLYKGRF
ncbi:hypothetical protein SLEP1_g27726 [Rubroshorea leprosula]|uniref:Uncharacterized protein n=1 Tax=Rubroshorea leprosula TaxID=152421 RepID=A0AAV5K2Q1_9ROSI|nr:hypothetical protein SLEP1_g27726 [Rubroshorea leprosula]